MSWFADDHFVEESRESAQSRVVVELGPSLPDGSQSRVSSSRRVGAPTLQREELSS